MAGANPVSDHSLFLITAANAIIPINVINPANMAAMERGRPGSLAEEDSKSGEIQFHFYGEKAPIEHSAAQPAH